MNTRRKNKKAILIAVWLAVIVLILIGILLLWPPGAKYESIQEAMQDGVLHGHNKMSLFGLEVNPELISACAVTMILLIAAALVRVFVIPRFKTVPGKFQCAVEKLVEFFTAMTANNSHHKPRFVGIYIIAAGIYIALGALFALLGVRWVTTSGVSMSLPVPILDINAAIAFGFMLCATILGAGIINGSFRRAFAALKKILCAIPAAFRSIGKIDIKKYRKTLIFIAIWFGVIVLILIGIILLLPPETKHESIQEVIRDGVLHGHNKMSLFGLEVNPGLISAYMVTAILLTAAALIRLFMIPKFKMVPGKFQCVIEMLVEFFSGMAAENSSHRPRFVGAYIFSAGVYIFFGTIFELFGFQWITSSGFSMSLPAPLSDINAAIALGFMSYAIILGTGIIYGGVRGALGVLKDFSLPISMSFRLFGALLSGLLVTELVYYYVSLSFVLPVIVGVIFTLLHALIQAYVLSLLVSIFYGEAAEPKPKKIKNKKTKR